MFVPSKSTKTVVCLLAYQNIGRAKNSTCVCFFLFLRLRWSREDRASFWKQAATEEESWMKSDHFIWHPSLLGLFLHVSCPKRRLRFGSVYLPCCLDSCSGWQSPLAIKRRMNSAPHQEWWSQNSMFRCMQIRFLSYAQLRSQFPLLWRRCFSKAAIHPACSELFLPLCLSM